MNKKYNETHSKQRPKEYRAWLGMKNRCYNSKLSSFKNYGKRGIKVCDNWRYSYENFLTDMGRAPTKYHSLDRKNSNGDYEPTNCIWSTITQQNRNKRTTKLTWSKVKELRRLRRSGVTLVCLGRQFDIHRNTAGRIARGELWT